MEEPAWFRASSLDLREDLEESAADGRRLLLYFYQEVPTYARQLSFQRFLQHRTERLHDMGIEVDLMR